MADVRTTCPYCGVGCGVQANVQGGRTVTISGDREHPANAGRLCSKGAHLGDTLGLDGRLLTPMIGDAPASWDAALDQVAQTFKATIAAHGPDSVAFYVSGQLLTEDYYVANKLMKGFIGSANIDTNSRLCMASAVAAHNRAFGEDVVQGSYADFEAADLIVLVGSNTAWCHPVLYQRLQAARAARGSRLVVIDPRWTETCEGADLHLPLRPGSDVALFNGLLAELHGRGLTTGAFNAPADACTNLPSLTETAQLCDLPEASLKAFFELFAATPRVVTAFSQGVNQSSQGTDKANAILNVHIATGRLGAPGMAAFSITGQPNAMGGREVGGLANQLAAHMGFTPEAIDRVQRFWRAPTMAQHPGLKAVDLFRAVAAGQVKALWIMATNPAVSLPEAESVRQALAACPFVVVSDVVATTDSGRYAHVRLPAAAWGEKDGTVTNSERMVSRQRAFLPAPGKVRPDWQIICDVAARMGWAEDFAFDSPAAIFREHAALTAFENDGARGLNLSGDFANYDTMAPFMWQDARGRTPTLVPVQQQPLTSARDWPFLLNTGRVRDQWHTMTRTGLSPALAQHRREPFVDVQPDDACTLGLTEGDLAEVSTAAGRELYRVRLAPGQRRGELFMPIHWTDQTASAGRTGRLVHAQCDPHSGQPSFKNSPAQIVAVRPRWRGFLLSRTEPTGLRALRYWAKAPLRGGYAYDIASDEAAADIAALLLGEALANAVAVCDARKGWARYASVVDGQLHSCLFLSEAELPGRSWLSQLFAVDSEPVSPLAVLAGRPAQPRPDAGETVCACFDVGLNTLIAAIRSQGLVSVDAIGAALKAGSNCGSCRPALQKLLNEERLAHAV